MILRGLTIACIVTGVLASGCATFRPKPISPVRTVTAFEARTLDNPHLKEFLTTHLGHQITPWPPKSWDFEMLTLVAYYYHPDLDVARAKWGVALASEITAGRHPNPEISFTPEYISNATSGVSPWKLTPTLDIPIETAGKRAYRVDQAKHLSEAERLNLSTATWQVRSRLRVRLIDFYTASQTGSFLAKQEAVREELVKLLEQRMEYGEASRPEVTQARISLAQTQISMREAQKQRAEARVQLADALGLPANALNGVHLIYSFIDRASIDVPSQDIRQQALLNRTDILSALSEYAASESALQLEIAKQFPDIRLGSGYSWDQGENKWSLGISVTLPILDQNQGPIAEAEARRKESAARFIALQAQVIGAVDRALAGYDAARHALETADRLVDARKEQQRSVQALFNAGQVDRLDLRSADLETAAAELSRFNTLIVLQRSIGSLEDAVHQPLNPTESVTKTVEENPRASEGQN